MANTNATVVRNNDFAVTITGRPNTAYTLWVSGTSDIAGSGNQPPLIKQGQTGANLGADPATGSYVFDTTGRTVAEDVPAAPTTPRTRGMPRS